MAKKAQSRSFRGTSRSERMQEHFHSNLNNIQPEHQALFRRLWMRMQGEAKKTGKAPHERFYDWLNEHPEALLELDERLAPSDKQIASSERAARKKQGLTLEAPKESPQQKARDARALAQWQRKEFRQSQSEEARGEKGACSIDLAAYSANLRDARKAEKNLVFGETICEEEFATLAPSAARSACSANRKRLKLVSKLAVLTAQHQKAQRAHACRESQLKRQRAKIEYELKLLDNILAADRQVIRKRAPRISKDIPF